MCNVTSIEENTAYHKIAIYPNPSSSTITLNFKSKCKISIINTLSEIVFTKSVENFPTQIDISSFPPGIYFVQCLNGFAKFVKQ